MSATDLVFGTQYYRPPFPNRETWSSDLNLIAASGMNTVKVWAVWSWIERSNGAYYFDDLDELIQLCGDFERTFRAATSSCAVICNT
jgi:beta-galactosidase